MRRPHTSSPASAVGAIAFTLILFATMPLWMPYWITLWQWAIGLAFDAAIESASATQ